MLYGSLSAACRACAPLSSPDASSPRAWLSAWLWLCLRLGLGLRPSALARAFGLERCRLGLGHRRGRSHGRAGPLGYDDLFLAFLFQQGFSVGLFLFLKLRELVFITVVV